MNQKIINIALVCTVGGHLEQLNNLSKLYNQYNHFWVTHRHKQSISMLENERKYFISYGKFKRPWTYLKQIPSLIKIFGKEQPTHVLSTGSGKTALIPFLFAKILRINFSHIDTFSRVNGYSKFGSFLLKMGHPILTQWKDHQNKKAIYIGPIFKEENHLSKNPNPNYIFVTLGTRSEPFTRLIESVEGLVKKGAINEKIIVQAGNTKYTSDKLEIFDFCNSNKIDKLIENAKYVITQESAGIGTKCLKYKTKFLVMPRDYVYGELITKSDMNEDLHIKLEELGYTKVVNNVLELENAINKMDSIKTGFNFDNKLAIETLTRIMEGL